MTLSRRRTALAFAALPFAQWALSLGAASTIRNIHTYDTAWYYVVARNVAQGRGLTDTVLWHFLATPGAVVQPAGTYWEIGWPLVLGTIMRVFGHGERAAIFITAALSALLPILVATVAWLATRRLALAFFAGLLIVAQTRLLTTNITPDVTLAYQLACLGAIAAFHVARDRELSRGKLAAVGAALVLPAYLRGEGSLVLLATVPLLLITWSVSPESQRQGARTQRRKKAWDEASSTVFSRLCAFAPLRSFFWLAVGMALVVLPSALRNLAVFGRVVPEARALRPWMTAYGDLFALLTDPTPAAFWAQGRARLVGLRTHAIAEHLSQLTLQVPWPLLVLAAIGAVAHLRAERGRALVLPFFAALTLLVPTIAAPLVSNRSRFVQNVLPVLCVLAAIGAFALVDLLRRLVRRRALDTLVLAAAFAASVLVFRGKATALTHWDALGRLRESPPAIAAGRTLALAPTDVVLTDDPWRVAADLDVTTVMPPNDGPAALQAVVERYRPRYVIATGGTPALQRLASSGRHRARLVAKVKDASWFELSW